MAALTGDVTVIVVDAEAPDAIGPIVAGIEHVQGLVHAAPDAAKLYVSEPQLTSLFFT